MITIVVTSCGRFDLLEQTMDSLIPMTDGLVKEILIHEDSGDHDLCQKVLERFTNAEVIFQDKQIGLSRSLDILINCVETEYVFTCEDDWLFHGNPEFMYESLKILQSRPDIHQVWIRDERDHRHILGKPYIIEGVPVKDVLISQDWNGFSWNPGLRRVSDIKRMFPNGFAEFGDEIVCARHSQKFNYKAVSLVNSTIKHIGWGRHTKNFKV